jgi:hypothetical protein
VLLDAVAELHRSGRRVTLAVAGDGEEGPALRDQVARLGLTGRRPLPRPYAGAARPSRTVRILVMASRAILCPMSPSRPAGLESLLSPVEVGGIPEILGSDGIYGPTGASRAPGTGDRAGA